MAAITDKFNKAANGTGVYPSVASVTAIREQGGSILSCDDLAGWATDTAVHFSTYRLMADGTVDTTTQSDWKGIVSGNTITQITHLAGNNDNGHLVGDKVELNPTISWLGDLIDGILKSHNQDGTLKDSVIQSKITDKIYPVGSIYISTKDTNPSHFLGGSWEAFAKGKTLIGVDPDDADFNASQKAGGEKAHTLKTTELPDETWISGSASAGGDSAYKTNGAFNSGSFWGAHTGLKNQQPMNNLQPYITAYMWKRTA